MSSEKFEEIRSRYKIKNKKLRNKILKEEAPKTKTTVIFEGKRSSGIVKRSDIETDKSHLLRDTGIPPEVKKLVKKMLKGKYESGAILGKDSGVESLAHELGHAKGSVSGGIRGVISKLDPRKAKRKEPIIPIYWGKFNGPDGEKVGLKKSIKDLIQNTKDSALITAEESAASRDGLRLLKKHGATKKELEKASKFYKAALGTYKEKGKASIKSSLGRIIDIPTRRN